MEQQPKNTAMQAATSPKEIVIGVQKFALNPSAEQFVVTRVGKEFEVKEIATIGRSDLFVIRDSQGIARAFKATVRLSERQKEIANVSGNWVVTIAGYNKLNQIAGLSMITPPSILFEGVEHANPYVEYKEDQIQRVIARKLVIGYSPAGMLVITDSTRH